MAVSLLECVSVLCHSALAVGGDPVTSDPLLETLQLLHGQHACTLNFLCLNAFVYCLSYSLAVSIVL